MGPPWCRSRLCPSSWRNRKYHTYWAASVESSIVPLNDVWIDANFKERQLQDMRVGQPVRIVADIYGGSVTYRGKIIGLGAGSGSACPPKSIIALTRRVAMISRRR